MFATAIRPVVSSVIMHQSKGVKLSGIAMAFFDAGIAMFVLAPVAVCSDVIWGSGIRDTFIENPYGWRNLGYALIGCTMAGFYGPLTFYTIKLTSSLTFIILGNFKQLLLLLGAAIFVDHVTSPQLWGGVAVACIAS